MLHSIECKPFRESTDTPTFHVIKPAANEVLREWHSFQLSIAVDILHDIGYIRSYIYNLRIVWLSLGLQTTSDIHPVVIYIYLW